MSPSIVLLMSDVTNAVDYNKPLIKNTFNDDVGRNRALRTKSAKGSKRQLANQIAGLGFQDF